MDLKQSEGLWEIEYDRLESNIESFRISFLLTRRCKCKDSECPHYKKKIEKIFGEKINHLLKKGILINAITDYRVMKSVHMV